MPLPRATLQGLADARLREARLLLDAGLSGGAFYLAGLSVEIGLKACIAAQFRNDEIPDWALTREFKSHDLEKLLRFANLMDIHADAATARRSNWEIVLGWRIDSRYAVDITQSQAIQLLSAVDDEQDGVLPWIRTRW